MSCLGSGVACTVSPVKAHCGRLLLCGGHLGAAPVASALGLLLDRALGEPPDPVHPVVALGRGLGRLERHSYASSRLAGVAHLGLALASTGGMAVLGRRTLGPFVATTVSVATASAGTMLGNVALGVANDLQAGDLEAARGSLRSLVGRDPSTLDEGEIARAVVESVAENTVDAVTATLFWAAVGGSTGIWLHRTVNTLDAMVGHRSDRYRQFGWASARLDDVMNWIPARLSVLAVALGQPRRWRQVITIARRDGHKHPSPNGGMIEAAFAGALDLRLVGANNYGGVIEVRGPLGDGRPPTADDIVRAVKLSKRVAWTSLGLQVFLGWMIRRWPRCR